jgi:hypothetical protein
MLLPRRLRLRFASDDSHYTISLCRAGEGFPQVLRWYVIRIRARQKKEEGCDTLKIVDRVGLKGRPHADDLRSDFPLKGREGFFSGLKASSPTVTVPTVDLPAGFPAGFRYRNSLFRSKNGVVKNTARPDQARASAGGYF